jgi:hypothetical protein
VRKRVIAPLASLLVGLCAPSARSQGNDRSAPTGGRSALMGNTGVALGADGAAPFLNPATIVRINDRSLAFSVNFYTFSLTHFSSWHQPGQTDAAHFGDLALGNTAVSTSSFNALPSTLCLFFTVAGVTAEGERTGALHRGRQKLAVCLGNVESSSVTMAALSFRGTTPAGATAQVDSFAASWTRLHVGPTYSLSLSDDFALGLSLHAVATADTFAVSGNSITSAAGGGAIQTSLGTGGNGHSVDLTAILGAIYRVGPVTLGASAQIPSLHLYGRYDAVMHSQYDVAGADTATLTNGTGSFVAPPPVRVAFGVGATVGRLTLEADGAYDFPTSTAIESALSVQSTNLVAAGATSTTLDATYAIASRPVVNLAAGGEYFVSRQFSLLGGASTNLSTLRGLTPTTTLADMVQSRTNSVRLSFGIGSYGTGGDLLIGTQLGFGWGEALAVNPYVLPNDWAVVSTQTYSAMVILAGATNLRAIGRAVERVENVVTGTPQPSK